LGTSKPSQSIAKTIEIEFTKDETTDTESSCVSPKVAGESGTCEVGKWMTHPAFQNFDVTGLWVGKFETGNDNGIIVKPNVPSWKNATVSTFFKTSYNYKRELDSHMMKNTEWGAVAYLSHSKYGINDEIRINNNSNYITGYASTDEADQSSYPGTSGTASTVTLPYNTETGYKATTTGNITGIYDMSGGTYEYVASVMNGTTGMSGLTSAELTNYSKYFDVYPSNSAETTWNNRILGDATGEMGPFYYYKEDNNITYYHNNWHEDFSHFILLSNPWMIRGGVYPDGALASQFFFGRSTGAALANSSRLVLTIKKEVQL